MGDFGTASRSSFESDANLNRTLNKQRHCYTRKGSVAANKQKRRGDKEFERVKKEFREDEQIVLVLLYPCAYAVQTVQTVALCSTTSLSQSYVKFFFLFLPLFYEGQFILPNAESGMKRGNVRGEGETEGGGCQLQQFA